MRAVDVQVGCVDAHRKEDGQVGHLNDEGDAAQRYRIHQSHAEACAAAANDLASRHHPALTLSGMQVPESTSQQFQQPCLLRVDAATM